jgi:hypothetical protein
MDEPRTEGAAEPPRASGRAPHGEGEPPPGVGQEPPPGEGKPPPTWEDFVRENGRRTASGQRAIPDFGPLIAIVEALRRAIPHELQEQFNALQRELLLTLRALIDWYLDRLDKPELTPQVEDIPIE